MSEIKQNIDALLGELVSRGGSDLHLTVGSHPVVRLHGSLQRLD
jgi:Tfp pilus assembly pilus retraction ATPase PilT